MMYYKFLAIFFSFLFSCQTVKPDSLASCMMENLPNNYEGQITELENYLVGKSAIESTSLKGYANFIENLLNNPDFNEKITKDIIKYNKEIPKLNELNRGENCCRNNKVLSIDPFCEKVLKIHEQGISLSLISNLLNSLEASRFDDYIIYRGTVLLYIFHELTFKK